ncbi:MAG: hypothetical protein PUC73_10365, partial [Lachnospiraceae bacterium]|nr:hypothetical protein [Lachnospiraceae bacterium]
MNKFAKKICAGACCVLVLLSAACKKNISADEPLTPGITDEVTPEPTVAPTATPVPTEAPKATATPKPEPTRKPVQIESGAIPNVYL